MQTVEDLHAQLDQERAQTAHWKRVAALNFEVLINSHWDEEVRIGLLQEIKTLLESHQ